MDPSVCLKIFNSVRSASPVRVALNARKHTETRSRAFFVSSTSNGQPQQSSVQQQSSQMNGTQDIIAPHTPVFSRIEEFRHKVAVSDQYGDYLYEDVYRRSWDLAKGILGLQGENNQNQRVCFLCPNGITHVITSWACWMSGNTAVPLCTQLNQDKLKYVIQDSDCNVVVASKDQADKVHAITKENGQKLIVLDNTWWEGPLRDTDQSVPLPEPFLHNDFYKDSNALILYTASQKPRAIILDHSTIGNNISCVNETWDWSESDSILHSLPLNTTYGLIHSLQAPLSSGARVVMMPKFDSAKVWSHLLGMNNSSGVSSNEKPLPKINTFPAVPDMYFQLLARAEELFTDNKTRDYVKSTCAKRIRLMMSSTSSLPMAIRTNWRNVTGHSILENYITTEVGTVFSNRIAGSKSLQGPSDLEVGGPAPGVRARIVRFRDHTKNKYDVLAEGTEKGTQAVLPQCEVDAPIIGELLVQTSAEANKIWQNNQESPLPMVDGWFSTGDIVQYSQGCYKIIGHLVNGEITQRGSLVNINEITKKLIKHEDIDDCYVFGLRDDKAETKIAAIVVFNPNKKTNTEKLSQWCKENLKEEEVPMVFKSVPGILRDQSGHVDKLKMARQVLEQKNMPVLFFNDNVL